MFSNSLIYSILIPLIIGVLALLAIFLLGIFLGKRIINIVRESNLIKKSLGFVFFEIRLPKSNEIEIKAAEQMFAGLLGIGGKKDGFFSGMLDPRNFVSFEIVAFKETIRFYVVCPPKYSAVVDRQINGNYPLAEITRVKEFNIFPEDAYVASTVLKLDKEYKYPILTYEELAVDSLGTVTDSLSKLHFNESAMVQIVISPAGSEWRKSSKAYIKEIRDKSSDPENKSKEVKEYDDTISLIDKKTTKPGFYVDVRIITVSANEASAETHLANIVSNFDQFTKEGSNKFKKDKKGTDDNIVTDVIHRISRESMILNVEELATVFHFPNKNVQAPFIKWVLSKKLPAPDYMTSSFKEDYMYLGKNSFRGNTKETFILPNDRMRHMYVIGQTGAGKSKLMAGQMVRDMKMGHGCAYVDPHGTDVELILQQVPPERVEDVVIFDPSDIERPPGLNMLEFSSDAQKTLAVNEMLNIFNALYDLKKTGGPMFEQYFRYGIMLLTADKESGSTLLEIPKIFTDDGYRDYKLDKCDDIEVVDFWRKQALKAGGEASLKNVAPYIVSKLASFLTNAYVRPIVAQQESSINFRDIMDNKKILLVKLSKGRIGGFNASLLGMIIVSKLLISALERETVEEHLRVPFYLYIDEFQNYLTDGIEQILSEARKYQLSLTLAHQYIGQLTREGGDTRIKEAIFGNVGNKAIMRIGVNDADFLAKELDGLFEPNELIQLENGTFVAKVLVAGKPAPPFTATAWYGDSPYDMMSTPNQDLADVIRQLSRLKYGKDKNLVNSEIKLRSTFIKESTEPKQPANPFGSMF